MCFNRPRIFKSLSLSRYNFLLLIISLQSLSLVKVGLLIFSIWRKIFHVFEVVWSFRQAFLDVPMHRTRHLDDSFGLEENIINEVFWMKIKQMFIRDQSPPLKSSSNARVPIKNKNIEILCIILFLCVLVWFEILRENSSLIWFDSGTYI